jgi:hypothetical protein
MLTVLKKRLIRVLESRGYTVGSATFAAILWACGSKRDRFFFVQIGAYDGREHDPIQAFVRRCRWRGILVEPQPEAFERLRRNYAGSPGLIFENVAIADHEGSLPLFMIKDEFAHLVGCDHRLLSSFGP